MSNKNNQNQNNVQNNNEVQDQNFENNQNPENNQVNDGAPIDQEAIVLDTPGTFTIFGKTFYYEKKAKKPVNKKKVVAIIGGIAAGIGAAAYAGYKVSQNRSQSEMDALEDRLMSQDDLKQLIADQIAKSEPVKLDALPDDGTQIYESQDSVEEDVAELEKLDKLDEIDKDSDI